jgi:hypothetical protein
LQRELTVVLGIDMMYAFLKHLYGEDDPKLISTMNAIEYAPHTNPNWDPFSIVHNVRKFSIFATNGN